MKWFVCYHARLPRSNVRQAHVRRCGDARAIVFRLYWKHYVLQSLFATVAGFVVLYFLSLQNAVIIASIGATAFIVFAMPDYVTAQPRNVIGGHLVGLFWGFVLSLMHRFFKPYLRDLT